jgi:hypothetical protein
MSLPHIPLQLTNARNSVAEVLRRLRRCVTTLHDRKLDPKSDQTRDLLTGMIGELAGLIQQAIMAVAPVEGELLEASNRTQSAHQQVITLAGGFRSWLEKLHMGKVSHTEVQPRLAGVGRDVDDFMSGLMDTRDERWRHLLPKSGIDFEIIRAAAMRVARCRPADEDGSTPAGQTLHPAAGPRPAGTVRPKRSTRKGDARAKLIAALTAHHNYNREGGLNPDPINNNVLARLAGVGIATASNFFKQVFGSHFQYTVVCRRDRSKLAGELEKLNGERPDRNLSYGYEPGGEDIRGEG